MASLSPLLELLAIVLSSILLHLALHELIPALTLTTKHPSFRAFVEGTGPNDAALWTNVMRQRLARFDPARAWFGLRSDLRWSKPPSFHCSSCAQKAEVELTAALEAGRVPYAQWKWETEGLSHVNARRLLFVPASVSAGKTMADFRAWVEAFACTDCHRSGAATNQCAVCGILLCSGHGCDNEEFNYPFALCGLHSDNVEVAEFSEFSPPDEPIFFSSSCDFCPEVLWCKCMRRWTSSVAIGATWCAAPATAHSMRHQLLHGAIISTDAGSATAAGSCSANTADRTLAASVVKT